MKIKNNITLFLSLILISTSTWSEQPQTSKKGFLSLSTETTNPDQSIGCNLSDVVDSPFRKNKSIILEAVKRNSLAIRFADPELFHDKKIALAAVQQFGRALQHVKLQDDDDVVKAAVKKHGFALEHASKRLKNNPEFLFEVMQDNFLAAIYIIKYLEINQPIKQRFLSLRDNREQVLAAIQKDGIALSYVAQKFRGDPEIVLQAMQHDLNNTLYERPSSILKYANKIIRSNKAFALKAVTLNSYAYDHLEGGLKQDQEIALAAVKTNVDIFDKLPIHLKTNTAIISAVASKHPKAYQYANKELRNNKALALKVIANKHWELTSSNFFNLISPELKKDRDITLAILEHDGLILQHVSESLKDDKKIVLKAIKNNGNSLQYAPSHFKNDKQIVLAAIKSRGESLEHASATLRSDKSFILSIFKSL